MPDAWKVQPSEVIRSMTFGFVASPGAARPVRSPLMSATKTGTPAFDSWPAISWSVLVLPVPVAPAISPWRLSIDRATWTRVSFAQLAVVHRAAEDDRRLGEAVAGRHRVAERLVHVLLRGAQMWVAGWSARVSSGAP